MREKNKEELEEVLKRIFQNSRLMIVDLLKNENNELAVQINFLNLW